MMNSEYHNPVLLHESVDGLNIRPDGVYVDLTFGGGGHSKEILNRLGPSGKLFSFDQDADALENKPEDERLVLIHQNFKHLKKFLRFYGVRKVDGVLGDLGVSSHQFDQGHRGFSTRFDGDLDMRMNQKANVSAFHVVNEYDESDLVSIFSEYGELRNAKSIASKITSERKNNLIKTSFQLKEVLKSLVPEKVAHKVFAQVFQAIRIEVNQEIEALKMCLEQTKEIIVPSGRLSVISYHSLEDRLVKRFIRNGLFEGEPEKDIYGNFEVPYRKLGKMILPSKEEIANNNRARSAKLRIGVKM